MQQEKLKQLAHSYFELWQEAIKQLENEVADVRKGEYSLETRLATVKILEDFLQRIRAADVDKKQIYEDIN